VVGPPVWNIDTFALFNNRIRVEGWLFDERPIDHLQICMAGPVEARHTVSSYGKLPSPDVAVHLGRPDASRVRFSELIDVRDITEDLIQSVSLRVVFVNGMVYDVCNLGESLPDTSATPRVVAPFIRALQERSTGAFLEIGSRARSGHVHKDIIPSGWEYTGLDVVDGPNVDVVGDAHELATLFTGKRFDAVFAWSVVEHLLMPWKMVVELNHVLKLGAVGLFHVPCCWPLHDEPWDFWRISDNTWVALLNKYTGFEIIDVGLGEPAYIVPRRARAVNFFGEQQRAFLSSTVFFRKIGDTNLAWPVSLRDVVSTRYPA
jgi:hypothetical protein